MSVDNPEFYFWRIMISLAHADGIVTSEEAVFLNDHISKAGFSAEEIAVLRSEMDEPEKARSLFECVTDEEDKARLYKMAVDLFKADGNYGSQEKRMLESIEGEYDVLQSGDFDELEDVLREKYGSARGQFDSLLSSFLKRG